MLYAKLTVVFPCMNTKGSTLACICARSNTGLGKMKTCLLSLTLLNALQKTMDQFPISPVCAPEFIDAVIVPMVAFDNGFQRLGVRRWQLR